MSNELQSMDVLKQALVTQNQHGEALLAVIERMEQQEKRIDLKIVDVENLVEKVSKEITINYEEQKKIQSIVWKQSSVFAEQHLAGQEYSDNLFKAWKGLFIRKIYAKLKTKMNVVRYTAIKRTDFDEAKLYLENLSYESFTVFDLMPTMSILKIIHLEKGDPIETTNSATTD